MSLSSLSAVYRSTTPSIRLLNQKAFQTVILQHTYRFTADVHDISEMIPWIRTFICRITELNFSDKLLENQFKYDIEEMYRIYGITEAEQ